MRILIATIGTRGDVQPYLALAVGLSAAGHQVAICTCARYAEWIERFGVTHLPLDDGLLTLLESPTGRLLIGKLESVWGGVKTAATVIREVGPINRRIVADAWAASERWRPDLIAYHPKLFCMPAICATRRIPAVLAPLLPMQVPTRETPFWGLPTLPLGTPYNRATWRLVEALTHLGTRGYMRPWRAQHDREGRSRDSTPSRVRAGEPITVLHGYSAAVSPRPHDWPAHAHVSGYWFLDESVGSDGAPWEPSSALLQFLGDGPPPVYIGFGSMATTDPAATTRLVLAAVARAGVRAVLARGWGGLVNTTLPANVFVLDGAPHTWLFPRMGAVVHHGGAGTTAAGLRAGCPTLICPFSLHQPYWGRTVQTLGVGPAPLPQKRLTAESLATAITQLVTLPHFRSAATELATRMSREDGVGTAVRILEQVAASHGRHAVHA